MIFTDRHNIFKTTWNNIIRSTDAKKENVQTHGAEKHFAKQYYFAIKEPH